MSRSADRKVRKGASPGLPPWTQTLPALLDDDGRARPAVPLQPRSPVEILDTAIKLVRANARSMVLTVLALTLPVEFLVAYLQRKTGALQVFDNPGASQPFFAGGAILGSLAVPLLVVPLACAGVSRIVLASHLGGSAGPGAALRSVLRHSPTLLVATIIVHLAEVLGSVAFVSFYFVMPLFMLTAPTISLEDLGPFAGISRSVRLAAERYWPTVGVSLLSGLLVWVIGQALGLAPTVVALILGSHFGWLILAVSSSLTAAVTVAVTTTIATMVYLDTRVRREGLDLLVQAAHLDQRLARQVPPSMGLS